MKVLPRAFAVGQDARSKIMSALSVISEAVGSTLGPSGRPFGFDRINADQRLGVSFSKDGLTVLKALDFNDPAWQATLQYCRQASANSVLASGDGTTSTILLANAVAQRIANSTDKVPQELARRMAAQANQIIEALREEAIKTPEAVRSVALTSTNGDQELTDIVLEAISHTSAYGTLLVEKNPISPVRYRIIRQEGYSNVGGYNYNQTLATSADAAAAASKPIDWERPSVILFNGHLMLPAQIDPMLSAWNESVKKGGPRQLVVITYEVSDEVANQLTVLNRKAASAGLGVMVVKPRQTAEVNSPMQIMRDIAAFCAIKEEHILDGGNYKTTTTDSLGTCGKIRISQNQTAFLGRAPNHWVEDRVKQNLSIIEEARSQFDKQITSIRNSELSDGLVKVEIGGGLLPDLQERADRFDDASKAAQACMRSGALPGAGASYIRGGCLIEMTIEVDLLEALGVIHQSIMDNFGATPFTSFSKGKTVRIDNSGVTVGDAMDLKVLDSFETVASVIQNGVALGTNLALLGGYSYRVTSTELEEYE